MHYNFEYYDYDNSTLYRVRQVYDDGYTRIVPNDSHDLAAWIAAANIPTKVSIARFLSVVDNEIVVDPNKDTILAAEEAARLQAEADILQKTADIIDALPSWAEVETVFENLKAAAQAAGTIAEFRAVLITLINIVRKVVRVDYWLAKNSST